MKKLHHAGFTLVELTIAAGAFAIISVGMVAISSTTTRLMARNLATNHSHESVRTSSQRMMAELHDAAAPFNLINFDGANYSTITPAAGSDVDPLSKGNLSQRANGVAFRRFSGGPCAMVTGTVPATSTTLTFNFGTSGSYTPQVGDKVKLPVINQTYDITAIVSAPSAGNPNGTISIAPAQIGYALTPTAANMVTGYFLRRVAYTVWNERLRYHPNFTGTQRNTSTIVRNNITSPRPFSLVFGTAPDVQFEPENLHVSIEAFDTGFSARRFLNGTTTYQTVVSPRTQPVFYSQTE